MNERRLRVIRERWIEQVPERRPKASVLAQHALVDVAWLLGEMERTRQAGNELVEEVDRLLEGEYRSEALAQALVGLRACFRRPDSKCSECATDPAGGTP